MPRFEQGHGGGGGQGFGQGFASSFSDIFEDLFGMAGQRGGGRSGGRERGQDLRYNMEITLEDAFLGKTAQIEIPVAVTCESCSGTGAKAGTKPKTCATCAGAGPRASGAGLLHAGAHLPVLSGPWPDHRRPVPVLFGPGPRRARAHLVGQHSAGRRGRHPHSSRRRRRGRFAQGGPAGDLYIFLSLATHEFFQRDGADLHCRVPISMVAAALGGDFEVPTIEKGKTKVKGAVRHPIRPPVPHRLQGHAGPALAPDGRHVCAGRGRDAAEPDQEAAGDCWPSSKNYRRVQPNPRQRVSSPRSRTSSAPAPAPEGRSLDRFEPCLYLFVTKV